jgi:Flp pilus assembly protein TadD
MALLHKPLKTLTASLVDHTCALLNEDDVGPALEAAQEFTRDFPDDPASWRLLGLALYKGGEPHASVTALRKSLALDPFNIYTMANLAFSLLSLGFYEEGWKLYEQATFHKRKDIEAGGGLYWAGEKTPELTLFLEERWGDTIQLLRFIPLLSTQIPHLHCVCRSPDLPLLHHLKGEGFTGFDSITCLDETPPLPIKAGSFYVALSSLPFIYKTTLANLPSSVPYLYPPRRNRQEQGEEFFQALALLEETPLPPAPLLKVGLVWSGKKDQPQDYSRSCPFQALLPLADLSGIQWFSLQKEEGADPVPSPFPFQSFSFPLQDWGDTLRAVAQLDLVISVDTAVAHLAGAMGKPTWVIHSFSPDWRWLHETDTSPWYPTVRLFRQHAPNQWEGVITRVRDQLERIMGAKGEEKGREEKLEAQAKHHKREKRDEYAGYLWQQTLTWKPNHAVAHQALAQWYEDKGDWESAQSHGGHALRHTPVPKKDFFLKMGALALKRGFYEEGFRLYGAGVLKERTSSEIEMLLGSSSQHWLIQGSPSLSETLFFLRFLTLFHGKEGRSFTFHGPAPLCRLLEKIPGVTQVIPFGSSPSLPAGEKTSLVDIRALPCLWGKEKSRGDPWPTGVPYLTPPAQALEAYGKRQIPGFNVGIGWQGEEGLKLHFQDFMPFFQIPQINWINLDTTEDPYAYTASIFRLNPPLKDYGDIGAFLLSTVDLLITADMGLAHLGGALGIPVWVITPPSGGHWSWGGETPHSPWYPTVRVFRQKGWERHLEKPTQRPLGPYHTVFTSIYQALMALIIEKTLPFKEDGS